MFFLFSQWVLSLIIAIGDFKERLVSLLAIIALFILNLWFVIIQLGFKEALIQTFVNVAFSGAVFFLTLLYFKYYRKIENPLLTHLGLGDVLLTFSISPVFQLKEFVVVFMLINILALVFGVTQSIVKNNKKNVLIPYAGIAAIIFVILSSLQYIWGFTINL